MYFPLNSNIVVFITMDSTFSYDYQFRLIVVGDSTAGNINQYNEIFLYNELFFLVVIIT